MKHEINWALNIIRGGNCDPFVYRDTDGIHVGDRDNHKIFMTVDAALKYAQQCRLSEVALDRARHCGDDNAAAEMAWHEDAGLQLDALKTLE